MANVFMRSHFKFYDIIFQDTTTITTYSPRNAHFGSWKNLRYAKPALVETDSYVLYEIRLSTLFENESITDINYLALF